MSGGKEQTYAHYTTENGYKKIREEGVIKESPEKDLGTDARYGQGAYVTKMDPSTSDARDVVKNNYDSTKTLQKRRLDEGKVDYAIKYTDTTSSHKKVPIEERDIHIHKGDLHLEDMKDLKYYKRDENNKYKQIQ